MMQLRDVINKHTSGTVRYWFKCWNESASEDEALVA
jgi:hypothetical protein